MGMWGDEAEAAPSRVSHLLLRDNLDVGERRVSVATTDDKSHVNNTLFT